MADQQNTCLLCLEPPKKPKVLGCAHTFCLECLERVVVNQNAYLKLEEAQQSAGEHELECPVPTCHQITRLPEGHVRGLPDLELPARATITEDDRDQQPFCKTHNMQMRFLCVPCYKLLCSECKAADHRQHVCKDVILEQPTALVEPALEVISKADSLTELVAQDREAIDRKCTATANAIRAFFDKLRGLLTHREDALLATVKKYGGGRISKMETHSQSLRENKNAIHREIETMYRHDQNEQMMARLQIVTERFHAHEQSVLHLQDARVDLNSSRSSLSFEEDDDICRALSNLGTLNECHTQPDDSVLPTRNPLDVSDYEVKPDICDRPPVPLPYIEPHNLEKEDIPYYTSHQSRETRNRRPRPLLPVGNSIVSPLESPCRSSKSTHSPSSDETSSNSSASASSKQVSWGPTVDFHDSSEDVHEAVYEELRHGTGANPPPLPPNHPNRYSFNFGIGASTLGHQGLAEKLPLSRTISLRSTSEPQLLGEEAATIIEPVAVLTSTELSWAIAKETVHPCGVGYIALHDTLVVTDVHNHCLRLIGSEGKFIEKVGEKGKAESNFKEPRAIAINSKNEIFVVERGNSRVQKFSATGKFLLKFGQKLLARGSPWGIAISSNGNVYVSDWKLGQIHIFQSNGKYVNTLAKDDGLLKRPAGIAFDKQNRLLVADRGFHCVWILSEDGEILGQMGSQGRKPGQLRDPYGVTVRDDGFVIISESGNSRISIFQPNGRFVRCFGKAGLEPGMFSYPTYVCVNTSGHILVADEMNQRIQVFET